MFVDLNRYHVALVARNTAMKSS